MRRKRSRSATNYSGQPPTKKRKTRHPIKKNESESLVDGQRNSTTRQNMSSATVNLAKSYLGGRYAALSAKTNKTIPGIYNNKDPIFDIKTNDPMFTTIELLQKTGSNAPLVFACLNGMSYAYYPSSEDMDMVIKFLGQSNSDYPYNDLGRDMIALTVNTSGSSTFTNNGITVLKEADRVGYIVGFYDSIQEEPRLKEPKEDWINNNSGSTKTTRVMPRLTKITPFYITDGLRGVFSKCLINVNTKDRSYFPTAKHITPISKGRNPSIAYNFSIKDKFSISKFNEIILSFLAVWRALVPYGLFDGVKEEHKFRQVQVPEEEVEEEGEIQEEVIGVPKIGKVENFNNLMDKINFLTGFHTSNNEKKRINELTPEGKNKLFKNQGDIIQQILKNYFYNYLPPRNKSIEKFKMDAEGWSEDLKPVLKNGVIVGQNVQNKLLFNRVEKIIGTVVKGGGVGKNVDIDFRTCK